ncbi:MAG: putative secreted protein [Candidatus Moranbacteria bacterium GW2011_GWA2_39_41]|nr:MAG: putative secreted protein [Candidatus Moranbacteria bacterium GW2011_GWA2_39_41]
MNKIKEFWTQYEYKIVIAIGFLLVAGISFEFGYVQGKSLETSPLVIEKPIESPKTSPESPVGGIIESNSTPTQKAVPEANSQQPANMTNCLYVGSKSSDKYYPPTCSYAKRIKPENLACFKTEGEATAQGRTRSMGCKY